jgi:hypothetical protein
MLIIEKEFHYFKIFAWAVEDKLFGDIVTSVGIYSIKRLGIVILPVTIG